MVEGIDVVIPVRNEAEALPWVLSRLPPRVRAIVVDNGSNDGSGDIARMHGATVVSEPVPGFGSACYAGLLAAQAPIVCFMDGDGSIDPMNVPLVAVPVESGEIELMLGARRPAPGAMTWHQRAANRILAFEMRRRTHVPLTDLGPLRACRREALVGLGMRDRRSGWPLEMVLRANHAGWRIAEVAVPYERRRGGHSKVTGTVKGTVRAVQDMSRLLAERQP